jgi:hypothetical protein
MYATPLHGYHLSQLIMEYDVSAISSSSTINFKLTHIREQSASISDAQQRQFFASATRVGCEVNELAAVSQQLTMSKVNSPIILRVNGTSSAATPSASEHARDHASDE